FARLIGLRTKTSIEYSTIPLALTGANWMSVITLLRESFGSSTPLAVPRSFSYWPTEPKLRPPNVGDCERAGSQVTLVISAWARDGARANTATMANAMVLMDVSSVQSTPSSWRAKWNCREQRTDQGRFVSPPPFPTPRPRRIDAPRIRRKSRTVALGRMHAERPPPGTARAARALLS